MKKFFCFGKNEICDNSEECFACPYCNGDGGQDVDTNTDDFIAFLLLRGYHIVSKGGNEFAILPPEGI